jgi:hypothetical protein
MAAFATKSYGMIRQLPSGYRSVGAGGVVTPIFGDRIELHILSTLKLFGRIFAELFQP